MVPPRWQTPFLTYTFPFKGEDRPFSREGNGYSLLGLWWDNSHWLPAKGGHHQQRILHEPARQRSVQSSQEQMAGKVVIHPIIATRQRTSPYSEVDCQYRATIGLDTFASPPYSPDLAPSDYHLFSALKKLLRGHHFANLDEMKTAVSARIAETPRIFFDNGIRKLTQRWEKCVKLNGDYIEKFDSDSDEDWSILLTGINFLNLLLLINPRTLGTPLVIIK